MKAIQRVEIRRLLFFASLGAVAIGCMHAPEAFPMPPSATTQPSPSIDARQLDPRFSVGPVLFRDDFAAPSDQWLIELEHGGTVAIGRGLMDIDVPAGATVWFKQRVDGPVLIEYRAAAVAAGGGNDRVSDLNCFWMARDSRNLSDIFAVKRSGKFADYNPLLTYYVGLGGNGNTTTRFRRYIGDATTRPLLPQNDLKDKDKLLAPNASQLIQLVADGGLVQFYRDGVQLFEMDDPQPYTSGWFAFRTTQSHIQIRSFVVFRLQPGDQ